MSILSLLEIWGGFEFGHVSETGLLAIIAIVTPMLVWAVPNLRT